MWKGILALLLALTVGELAAQELVQRVQMFRDDGGERGQEVTEFRPEDRRQHFRVALGKLQVGNRAFRVRYVGEETTEGNEIPIADADFAGLLAEEITSQVELPNDWPLGRYRLEVLMDGTLIGSHRYIVTPPWSEQIIGYWALYADQNGEPAGDPIKSFRSSQRRLHFEAQTTGYIKRGALVTFQLLDPEGAVVVADEFRVEPDSQIFNILTFNATLPSDWPPGTYRIQALSGKRLLGVHEFEIVGR